jgi:hypothetical protein
MLRIASAAFAFPFPQTSGTTPGLSNPESEAVLSLPKATGTSPVKMFFPGPGQQIRG